MFETYRDMVDRLRNRELGDRWAFLLFAMGGSALIWVTKSLGVDPVYVALGAMLIMIAYAAIVNIGPKLKLRADQLGDNCYYLGLIFTLASLSYAIFTFDPANTATTIVQGFGVALVSTVLGLVLRVFFSQGQPDLAMAEENARIALTETAALVRAELDGVVLAFQTFAVQTQQHLTELRDQVRSDVEAMGSTAMENINVAAEAAKQTVTEQSIETVSEVRKITTSVGRLSKTIEAHADAIGAVSEKAATQLGSLTKIEKASNAAAEALTQVTSAADMVQRYQVSLNESSTKLAESSSDVASNISKIGDAVQRFDSMVKDRLDTFGQAPLDANARLNSAMEESLAKWQTAISLHADSHEKFLQSLEQARGDELNAARRHNNALEIEVARSREMVSKVHAALVDMTNELTAQVTSADH